MIAKGGLQAATQLVEAPQPRAASLGRPLPLTHRRSGLAVELYFFSSSARRGNLAQQRRRRLAATAASASASAPRPAAKHFLRPSLLATGLSEPEDVLQHALALFRKADLSGLAQYLPESYAAGLAPAGDSAAGSTPRTLAASPLSLPRQPWLCLAERGPLAPLAGVLDVGARRVLPGHLLRRSQVLSTLRPSPGLFQQRTALTARSGETSVFDWVLRWHPIEVEEGGNCSSSHGSSRSSGDSDESRSGSNRSAAAGEVGGRWVIESVRRDASADVPLPTTPHPKAAPEAVLRAQLAALQAADVFEASSYCMRAGSKHMSSRRTSLVAHHDALRSQLQQEPYRLLLNHAAAQLGPAALPTLRDMLQEVAVLSPDGASARFVWRLRLAPNGCWMTSGIYTAEEAAALAAAQQEEQAQQAAEQAAQDGAKQGQPQQEDQG